MKYCLFNQAQAGDLCINTVPARLFKIYYPESTLFMNVNEKYVDLLPLFYNHPHIDGFRIWEGWDTNTPKDLEYLKYAREHDIVIGSRMPKHSRDDWYKFFHQGEEACYQNGFPKELVNFLGGDFSCYLNRWFSIDDRKDYIAFAPFAGFYNPNSPKKLSVEKAQEIVDLLVKLGYKVLQIGGPDEPVLSSAEKFNGSYFESMKAILSCKLLITTDTWCSWYSSAYKFPTIHLLTYDYYSIEHISSIIPSNSNGNFIANKFINDITISQLEEEIKKYG